MWVLNPWYIASILLSAATRSYLLLPWASARQITAHTLFLSEGVTELVNGVKNDYICNISGGGGGEISERGWNVNKSET